MEQQKQGIYSLQHHNTKHIDTEKIKKNRRKKQTNNS